MYSRLQLAEKYLSFYLRAANGRGHGIHSPFVYDFVRNVLRDKTAYPAYERIGGLRRTLLRDPGTLRVADLGAGSVSGRSPVRSVAEIARNAAKPPAIGRLLFRLARHYRPSVIVELGTSLGLSAAYLASGARDGHREDLLPAGAREDLPPAAAWKDLRSAVAPGTRRVWTIEGCQAIAGRAVQNMAFLGLSEVEVLSGNFDDVLPPLLDRTGHIDLAFVDGNHRYEPTLRYFEMLFSHAGQSAILVFDDIHWSSEMERAWDRIKADPRVLMTIDLFYFGLVVCRQEFKVKQDFAIRFWK